MWVTLLGLGAGFCLYAGLLHFQLGRYGYDNKKHYVFSSLSFAAAVFFTMSSICHHVQDAELMVILRKVQISAGILFIGILPWFALIFCHQSQRFISAFISLYMFAVFVANIWLPFGLSFSSMPPIRPLILPWGEVVTDLRSFEPSIWWDIWWLGIFFCFAYTLALAWISYRRSHRRELLFLLAGMWSFLLCIIVQFAINERMIAFTNMGELGFIFLIFLMSYSIVDELSSDKSRLRVVMESMPIAVYLKDAKGRYQVANNECEQFLGHPAGFIIGRSDSGLLPEARLQRREKVESESVSAGVIHQFEESVEMAGSKRVYAVMKIPLFDQNGELYGICGVARDLTSQREAEQQIREIKQQLWHVDRVARTGMLTSTLIHELAQPLAAAKNTVQAGKKLLSLGLGEGRRQADIEQMLDDILRDVVRAATVTSGMRTFLQKNNEPHKKVKVMDVIAEITNIFKAELQGKNVELQLHCSPNSNQYLVDIEKSKLQQIFLNIIMNAVDAMDGLSVSEKCLRISMIDIGDRAVQIIFSDSGIGIPAEHLDKIFEPFWTSKREGMGLGLPICKAIIDENNGEICIVPNQGRGVSVIINLPMSRHA